MCVRKRERGPFKGHREKKKDRERELLQKSLIVTRKRDRDLNHL